MGSYGINLRCRNFTASLLAAFFGIALATAPALARDPSLSGSRCLESALRTLLQNAPAGGTVRPLEEIKELKIATYNLLNLQEHVGQYRYGPDGTRYLKDGPKPAEAEKIAAKARAIREINPDILIAQEIEGGVETLQRFADQELEGAYKAYLAQGNDSRGINIGFLVKKDLPLTVEMESHRNLRWVDPTRADKTPVRLYSRDVPALILRASEQPNADRPLLVVLGNHSKSMRDRPGDPRSMILRKAQAKKTAELALNYSKRFGDDVRIVIGGDFNTHVESREMSVLTHRGLSEAFKASKTPVAPADRVTHTFHPRDGPRELTQLDAFFVSPSLSKNISRTWVYRYKNAKGKPLPLPRSYDERELNPSDHFPLVMELEFQPIYKRFKAEQARGGE